MDNIDFHRLLEKSSECNSFGKNLSNGVNFVKVKDTTLPCVFYAGDKNVSKLYVFLTAIGVPHRPYPFFQRLGWINYFQGVRLFFDDPTRNEIGFAPAFYFGKKENNYLDAITQIIKDVQDNYNISSENICFISSSNGGFAAIYLCNEFTGSKCISLCPQLDVKLYLKGLFDSYTDKLEISNDLEKFKTRLNLYDILVNNKKSKFIIFSNIASASDKAQMDSFAAYLGCSFSQGLNIISDNIYLCLYEIAGVLDEHLVQPNHNMCQFIDRYFFNVHKEIANDIVNLIVNDMREVYTAELRNFIYHKLISNTRVSQIKYDYNKNDKSDKFCDIYFGKSVYIRIRNYNRDKICPDLRILNYNKFISHEKMIIEFTSKNNLLFNCDGSMLRIYSKDMIEFKGLFSFYAKIVEYFHIVE